MTLSEMKSLSKEQQKELFERLEKVRHNGKTASYACQYGAGVKTIARQTGLSEAKAAKLHKAYWEINWAVKKVAEDCKIKNVNGRMWLFNPVNKFWYSLRTDKDRFSTLVQGTGTYCFDMWVKEILKKPVKLIATFHDEVVLDVPAGYNEGITRYLKDCVMKVNKSLNLNRDLDCDVEFGGNYSEVH